LRTLPQREIANISKVGVILVLFFFQAEDGIRDFHVTGVQTCALPISRELIGNFWAKLFRGRDRCREDRLDRERRRRRREQAPTRSEERRVGKERRSRWAAKH